MKYKYNNGIQIRTSIAEIIAVDVLKDNYNNSIEIEDAVNEELNMEDFDIDKVNPEVFKSEKALCVNILTVKKEFRRNGWGSFMLQKLIDKAQELHYKDIFLNSSPMSDIKFEALLSFYKKFGFVVIDNDGLNALMVKHI